MAINNNGVANVKSGWDSGDFVVLGNDNTTELIRVDGVNNTVDISGTTLSGVNVTGTATFAQINFTGGLTAGYGADVAIRNNPIIYTTTPQSYDPRNNDDIFLDYNSAGVLTLTLETPTATDHDGANVSIVNCSDKANIVLLESGFFSGGPRNKATFSGAAGDYLLMKIYNGSYWIVGSQGVTLSTVIP